MAVLVLVGSMTVDVLPEEWGPVTAVAALGLGIVLASLGRTRPASAAWLMLLTAGIQVLGVIVNVTLHSTGVLPPGPGAGGSPALLVTLAMALAGVAFLRSSTRDAHAEELSASRRAARPASSLATGTRNGEHET